MVLLRTLVVLTPGEAGLHLVPVPCPLTLTPAERLAVQGRTGREGERETQRSSLLHLCAQRCDTLPPGGGNNLLKHMLPPSGDRSQISAAAVRSWGRGSVVARARNARSPAAVAPAGPPLEQLSHRQAQFICSVVLKVRERAFVAPHETAFCWHNGR